MVKVEKKKKKKEPEKIKIPISYERLRTVVLSILVFVFAYVAYVIRNVTSDYKYFFDPDTFYHYEIYKLAIHNWLPKFFAYADPPIGLKIGEPVGLYDVQAWFYKITHALFGTSVLGAFKHWPPFVGAMTVIAIYLLGRKLHSDWAGFWGAAFVMFSMANFTKTFSGVNRGEGPFMMFFLFAVVAMAYYLDERKWNWKKSLYLVFFLLLSILYTGVWNGSQFGIGIILLFTATYSILLFLTGHVEELKRFFRDFYPPLGLALLISVGFAKLGFIAIYNFLIFAFEVYLGLAVLTLIMLYGSKVGLNYLDWKHRLAVVIVVGIVGFSGAYAYFGRGLLRFLGQATRSDPLYQTVAELRRTHWGDVVQSYSIRLSSTTTGTHGDAILFLLGIAGALMVIVRFLMKVRRGEVDNYKEIFLITYYLGAMFLLSLAVRFIFQASGAVLLLAGVAVGELFTFVENMKERLSTKAIIGIALILLFLPIPVVGAQYTYNQAKATAKSKNGMVPVEWINTLKWMRETTNPFASATSWWDYGYWIESSLLAHRRSSTDGGHAYDRRYIVAKFYAHSGLSSEVDFEAWELNYFIAWSQDFAKFNAISYLGGGINYGEYNGITNDFIKRAFNGNLGTIIVLPPQYRGVLNYTIENIDILTGKVTKGKGLMPYVGYIVPAPVYSYGNYSLAGRYYIVLAYRTIANSNFIKLAWDIRYPHDWDTQKLFSNFRLVHSDVGYMRLYGYYIFPFPLNTYNFTPFAVYRIDVWQNDTWKTLYTTLDGMKGTLPLGKQKVRLWISAFGRNVTKATIVFEAMKNGKVVSRQVVAKDVNMNYRNEKPIVVNITVPNATDYRFYLYQTGPVGVVNGPVMVNGQVVRPENVLPEGGTGTISLTEAFRRPYTVNATLRFSIVYYVAPNGTDIYKRNFYLIPHMDVLYYDVLAKNIHVRVGNNTLEFKANVPTGIFEKYIAMLRKKYGNKVVIVKKRIEPIFLARKRYLLWSWTVSKPKKK